jgi:hypothetical protein
MLRFYDLDTWLRRVTSRSLLLFSNDNHIFLIVMRVRVHCFAMPIVGFRGFGVGNS